MDRIVHLRAARAGRWKTVASQTCLLLLLQGCATNWRTDSRNIAPLQQSIRQLACRSQGHVGAAISMLETGEVVVTVAGNERFPMQSVYKLPIAMAVLHNVDTGHLRIDQSIDIDRDQLPPPSLYSPIRDKFPRGTKLTIRELIRYAVSESDNIASDILLGLAGGPEAVTRYLRSLHLDEITVATTEREMAADAAAQYRNWATPRGAVKLLAALHFGAGLSPQSRAILMEALTATVTGPRRIKGLLPPDTPVAHKTGTSATVSGRTAATNDIGIVTLPDGRHIAIAVFVSDSPADTKDRELIIARIAQAAYDWFAQPPGARPR